ncbi:MAG: SIS domain-containing protein [Candidatus Asgardarchaeia archaeon]
MHKMLKEVMEQSETFKRAISENRSIVKEVVEEIDSLKIDRIILTGHGTSLNAAKVFEFLMDKYSSYFTKAVLPEHIISYKGIGRKRGVLISVSQSGETPSVVKATELLKKRGFYTLGVTNKSESSLSEITDINIDIKAGPELAVAATKTYTSTLAVLYLIFFELMRYEGNDLEFHKQMERIPEIMNRTLSRESTYRSIATYLKDWDILPIVGVEINSITSREASLKFKETCYIFSEGFNFAEFFHGPLALLREGLPIILFLHSDNLRNDIRDLIERVLRTGARPIIISNKEIEIEGCDLINLEFEMNEDLTPPIFILPIHMLAYYTSTFKGINPDSPRHIGKVTMV